MWPLTTDLFPKLRVYDKGLQIKHLKSFPKRHNFRINSLDLSINGQHFLSCDDDTLFVWNLEKPEAPHSLGDRLRAVNLLSQHAPAVPVQGELEEQSQSDV